MKQKQRKNKYFTGVVDDPRSNKEKKKDWTSEELIAGTPYVIWTEKTEWKRYTPRNQSGTNSCVAQGMAKAFEVAEKIESGMDTVFSATPIYAKRANKPSPGMWLQNALDIAVNSGTTLESRIPSQNLLRDAEMEREFKKWDSTDEQIAKKYKSGSYATVKIDMDEIAHFINQGRAVNILIYANKNEYYETPKVKTDLDINNAPIRHNITVVDKSLFKGNKILFAEDSAHFNGFDHRFITEDFLKQRCYGAGVLFDLPNEQTKPVTSYYRFENNLSYGMRLHPEVERLQDKLKQYGFFPSSVESTGNYLQITAYAVKKFQEYYKVASQWEINLLGGKVVGPKTRAKLNEL